MSHNFREFVSNFTKKCLWICLIFPKFLGSEFHRQVSAQKTFRSEIQRRIVLSKIIWGTGQGRPGRPGWGGEAVAGMGADAACGVRRRSQAIGWGSKGGVLRAKGW